MGLVMNIDHLIAAASLLAVAIVIYRKNERQFIYCQVLHMKNLHSSERLVEPCD